ncbi:MAG: hypothetical protein KJP14_11290 [Eudoraea sp.]|nr:hypothetical protein [Eudoraea sp.]MBT8221528.1 hypothetical protein [Eudoraea sp.]
MKRFILCMLFIPICLSCDPVSLMDANIENSTGQAISITFVASGIPDEILAIAPNETVLFREGMSTTGGFLEPSLVEFDSVYIQSEANEILKIFKPNSAGKNIYNVEDSWIFTEPSKRVYQYDYLINNEDLEY